MVGKDSRALDPDLLLWVHATLVDSALVTYETFIRPLDGNEREDFYRQMNQAAALLGLPSSTLPPTIGDFTDYVRAQIDDGPVRVGDLARDLARLVVRPRVLRLPGAVFVPFELITTGLLPATLREQYGFPWGDARQKVFRLFTIALPRIVAVTPPVLRVWPLPGRNVRLGPDFSLSS